MNFFQVAWLFNIRGSDVSYCPVVHAFAVVTLTTSFFYVDQRKVSPEVSLYLDHLMAGISSKTFYYMDKASSLGLFCPILECTIK